MVLVVALGKPVISRESINRVGRERDLAIMRLSPATSKVAACLEMSQELVQAAPPVAKALKSAASMQGSRWSVSSEGEVAAGGRKSTSSGRKAPAKIVVRSLADVSQFLKSMRRLETWRGIGGQFNRG